MLMFDKPQSIEELSNLAQNTSHVLRSVQLLFAPKPTKNLKVPLRRCSFQGTVICRHKEGLMKNRIANLSLACQALISDGYLHDWTTSTSSTATKTILESQTTDNAHSYTTSASTTLFSTITPVNGITFSKRICTAIFFDPSTLSKSDSNFSTLLDVQTPGSVNFLAPSGSSSDWSSVHCVKDSKPVASETSPCKVQVTCGLGRIYSSEEKTCLKPEMMTLRVESYFKISSLA
ncbi:hypothetical protein RRG08_046099 [Elysia crispata]|uniref:Uncharacterized protein n=1 Tax=Elysia crispata TaxID=231223 RepID=A0AAE0Y4V8_9GAST|nr:hypothetical protein RRG08_046099 [Elysia crispata]